MDPQMEKGTVFELQEAFIIGERRHKRKSINLADDYA